MPLSRPNTLKPWIVLLFLLPVHGANDDSFASTLCESSIDCIGNSYCASGICLEAFHCTVREDCLNQYNNFGSSITCEGYATCALDGTCGMECDSDVGVGVNDQNTTVSCSQMETLPCDVETCNDAIQCFNDNFGGCHAVFFDSAGNQVCKEKSEQYGYKNKNETSATTIVPCTSDSDCHVTTEYCASGTCMEVSACQQRLDCNNPSNFPYAAFTCVGYVECREGRCQMECGDSLCPDGKEPVQCDPLPCDVEDCPDAVSCHNDNCGECRPIFFDAAGNQVCMTHSDEDLPQNSTTRPVPNNSIQLQPCNRPEDCLAASAERSVTSQFYCGHGICLERGTCGTDADCDNPRNEHDSDYCVGYNRCNRGWCERVCGPPCPNEATMEEACELTPCDSSTRCPGSVFCRNDPCNGCKAIHYDVAGHVMSTCDAATDGGGQL
ncbi:hypothetical protein IV203_030956 [Nitzschia inconspicua]|uniref:Uncharacterized protein n=1 Tax=Nitzschia inconspicua TaxID=303405 RepID=A0A9K3LTG6_9STRA|nr:hypothetical protein IV203_030956 [Nitzschia inconspicua]